MQNKNKNFQNFKLVVPVNPRRQRWSTVAFMKFPFFLLPLYFIRYKIRKLNKLWFNSQWLQGCLTPQQFNHKYIAVSSAMKIETGP